MLAFEGLLEYMERDGLRFRVEDHDNVQVIVALFVLDSGTVELRVMYDGTEGIVIFAVTGLPLLRPRPDHEGDVARLLLYLNRASLLGAFSLDADGDVAYDVTLPLEGTELPYGVYRRIVASVLETVDRALPSIAAVGAGQVAVEEAMREAMAPRDTEGAAALPGGSESGLDLGPITQAEVADFHRALRSGPVPPPAEDRCP